MKVGQPVADFTATATDDETIRLSDLKGQHTVIYFYPKDHTPGCTREGHDFRDLYAAFETANARIIGVSRDSLRSHQRFREKHGLPFALISDPDETLCRQFDVIKEKNMYGRKVMGIERSTFLIDATGVLRAQWRKVRVPDHAQTVLETVVELGRSE